MDDRLELETVREFVKGRGWAHTNAALGRLFDESDQTIKNWESRGVPSAKHPKVARRIGYTVDELTGRAPPDDGRIKGEFERQLMKFFRGISGDRQDDILYLANRWYSFAHPEDKSAAPFNNTDARQRKPKAKT